MRTFLVTKRISLTPSGSFRTLFLKVATLPIVSPITFKVLHTGYGTSGYIRWNAVTLDDTPYSLFPQVTPLELDYVQCVLRTWLLPVRPEVVPSFRLASGTMAVHPELEFTLYAPGTPDGLCMLGVSGYELFFLLM